MFLLIFLIFKYIHQLFLINKMGADESSIKSKRNKQISKNKFLNEDEFCHTENNENNYSIIKL